MEWIELGELVKIRKGKKLDETGKTPNSIRMIMIEDLRGDMNYKYTNADEKNIIVGERDIVIAWDGANAGTIGFNLKGAIGSTLARLSIQSENVSPKYLGNFLRSKFNEIRDNCTGATIPHVSRDHLISLKIPVPPMEIQEKIVKVLDQAQALIDKRKEQIEALDQLIESIFYTMFGDPVRNEKGWEVKELEEVLLNNVSNIKKDFKDDISYIDIGSINNNNNSIETYNNFKIKDAPSRAKRILNHGDILFSTVRPNLKNIAIFDMYTENTAIGSTGFCIIRVNESLVNNKYIFNVVKNKRFTGYLVKIAEGASYPAVKDSDIKSIKISIPPLSLQNEFAQKVQIIEKQKKLLEESLELLDENYKSIMDNAFKGQLFN